MTAIVPWTIETSVGDVTADWLEGTLFNTAPGDEVTATFAFVSWGEPVSPRDRHGALQPLVDAARDGVTIRTGVRGGATDTGLPYYREELTGFDEVDSLLVALLPEGDRRGAVWAILRSGSDATPGTEGDVFVWELELTVLKRYEGEDRAEIEAEYGDEVL
ncbi:hypothetical protein [Halorarum salinum]|uniref:Uncharacterized protein n=1 Tax=Halorarum salinum TaxID=2743089 RepID=A0A7D5QBE0_9EURY|nr:hypothetical protein [Halobaculum salinum]QLG63077.1 hypothetical protein HUG12_15590 [Halobaculum salinum]